MKKWSRLLISLAPLIMASLGIALVFFISNGGFQSLSFDFFFTEPQKQGTAGGISSVLISTLWVMILCMSIVAPIGTGSALFLVLYGRKKPALSAFFRACLDLLAGTPSIVFGIFGLAFFCDLLGLGVSVLSGALILSLMILPFFIRSFEEALSQIAPSLIRMGLSSGLSMSHCLFALVLPVSFSSLVSTFILSLGRALAETAALLFTAGYVLRSPESIFDPGRVLSVHIYELSMNIPGGDQNALGAALTLLITLMLVNAVAHKLRKISHAI